MGVGLIGGSIGKALRAGVHKKADHVIGIGRDQGRLAEAEQVGAIDQGFTDIAAGVAQADVVVICTPVDRVAMDAIEAAQHAPGHALITDAGSTKQAIVSAVEADPIARTKFVGAHPIAGSERSGVAFAREDLFRGRVCVLTATEHTPVSQIETARRFWKTVGARLVELDPTSHDSHLARTSHLPHVLAAAQAAMVGGELVPLAAGAYRDVTRVAGADASLWTAIFLENRRAVLQALDDYNERLEEFRAALQASDVRALTSWWNAGQSNRRVFDAQNSGESIATESSGE